LLIAVSHSRKVLGALWGKSLLDELKTSDSKAGE